MLNWLPSYLSIAHHMDLLHSSFYTAGPWLFATATDIAVGGWLVDFLIQRGWNANRVRQTVLIVGTGVGLAVFWRGTSEQSASSAGLDQLGPRRACGCGARRLDGSFADCAAK